jgi:low temperature requirement protein LtrA
MLIASLAIPGAFEDDALLFALAYLGVRLMHIVVFAAATEHVDVRDAARALAPVATTAPALLLLASAFDGAAQTAVWIVALLYDYVSGGLRGIGGWRLSPGHFAERHGLIVIIALGESIVAIGVGAELGVDAGVVVAATLGVAVAAALWWLYFDVVALVAARRLARAVVGREQNEMARDSYSYLHFPMVAGIVLVALGIKKTLGDVGEPLDTVPAAAMLGGAGVYLLAHVAFRLRNLRTLNRQRLACALLLLALIPVAVELPALATLGLLAAVLAALIAYEALRFSGARDRVRHQLAAELGEPEGS